MLVIMAFLLRLYGNFSRNAENIRPSAARDFRPRVNGASETWRWLTMVCCCAVPGADRVPVGITLWVPSCPIMTA